MQKQIRVPDEVLTKFGQSFIGRELQSQSSPGRRGRVVSFELGTRRRAVILRLEGDAGVVCRQFPNWRSYEKGNWQD